MNRWIGSIVLMVCAVLVSPSVMAQAALTINITHQGDDVVADISGQVDLSNMSTFGSPSNENTKVSTNPTIGSSIYLSSTGGNQSVQKWQGLTDAPNFPTEDFWTGDGALSFAAGQQSTSSGASFIGLETGNSSVPILPLLVLPENYVSGTQIDFEVRWDDVTVTDLNLNPGAYAWEAPDVSTQSDNVVVLIIEPPPAPTTFTIGGSVSGLASGESAELVNNGGDALSINSNGNFTFGTAINTGSTYEVTVSRQPSNQTCQISNGTGTATATVTDIQVTCTTTQPPAPSTFSIGGFVSGLSAGESVELVNNGGDALLVNADGNFTFATNVSSGAAYAVTVNTQPNGQSCEIDNGTGSATANVTNVQVTCIAAAPALPVPTLSMWLLAVMALLIVIAGVWNTRLIRYS